MRSVRILPVAGLVSLSVALSACGGSDEPADQAAETSGPSASPASSPSPSATSTKPAKPSAASGPGLSAIVLGSLATDGRPTEFPVGEAALSGDGNFLAFRSPSVDGNPAPTKGTLSSILVRDLRTQSVVAACSSKSGEAANGSCESPSLSNDGRFLAFASTATNLVAADRDPIRDVFRKDLQTGEIVLVSTGGTFLEGNPSGNPTISADGGAVAFDSGPGGAGQVYVRNVAAGQTTLLSKSAAGEPGDNSSTAPKISADGTTVVFGSLAGNLAGKPRQGARQVLIAKVATGKVVSLEKLLRLKLPKFNFVYEYTAPSANGSRLGYTVVFDTLDDDEDGSSEASSKSAEGVFVADLVRARTIHTTRTANGEVDRRAGCAELSADGKQIAYCTYVKRSKGRSGWATFLAEVDRTTVRLISGPPGSQKTPDARSEAISADGGVIVFRSDDPQRGVDAKPSEGQYRLYAARPAD